MNFPVKVDKAFYDMAKNMIAQDPTLNLRKVTKKFADHKMVFGEIFNNPEFEKEVNDIFEKQQKRIRF